jgi:hypothetical protein
MRKSFATAAAHAAMPTASMPVERSKFLVLDDVIRLLHSEIAAAGGQSQWARQKSVNRTSVVSILSGRRNLQPKILRALGLEEITVYRRVRKLPAGRRTPGRA